MTNIARFFLENYKFTMVVTVFFVFFGYGGLTSLTAESFPAVDIGSVIISTQYLGATAEDIESKITKPIEDEIRSVTGIKEVKSVSQPGQSKIMTIVDIDNYPVDEVIADLQRAVDRVPDLPVDLENPPEFIEINTEEFPVIEVAIAGENTDRLRDRVALEFEEELEDNKAIATINKSGYRDRQFSILVDPAKLQKYHVGLSEVTRAIATHNVTIPAGTLESQGYQTLVKLDGKIRDPKQLQDIVVRANFSGGSIKLKDIAQILDAEKDPLTLTRINGEPATLLTISKKSGADILKLADEVKEKIKTFNEKYQGRLTFQVYSDEGVRVGNRMDVLTSNGMAGLFLVVFFLMVFLPGRVGFMASLSLPLAVFATFGYLQMADMSFNTITILAMVISIGMLVDNAVVIAENYVRLTNEGMNGKEAALESVRTLWLPITATALTTIAAFIPMLVTKGIMGQFIRGIPLVVTASLVLSLIECFILLPMRLVTKKDRRAAENGEATQQNEVEPKKDWFAKSITPAFEGMVRLLIKRRYLSAIGFSGLILFSLFMMTVGNKFILFPADQTEIYLGRVELPRGTTIETTHEAMKILASNVQETLGDDLKDVTTIAGKAEENPDDPKGKRGENVGFIRIFMTEDAKNNRRTNDVLAQLREIQYPDADLSFEALINGPPVGAPVTAIFRSNNAKQLQEAIEKVKGQLEEVEGVFDVKIDDVYGEEEVYVDVDSIKAKRLGLSTADIGDTLRAAIAGIPVTNVNVNNREVDYFVRLQDQGRQNSDDLLKLKIMNRQGDLIPLGRIATVRKDGGTPHIKRFDYKPAKTITANINDDIITSVVANQKVAGFFKEISNDYKEVSLKFGGEAERTAESFESLLQALVLSLIGIFALLVFLFSSYVKPLIILTTIPLGLVGVSVAFFLHQRPMSFLALIGIVGLGGIIVNSGIVLISFIETLKQEKPGARLIDVLVEATGLRLRAVVVTSLTTVSGLLPTAYGIGGSDEFIIPMTLAMAWGLVSGTALALLWVPCAYAITEDIVQALSRSKSRIKFPLKTSAEGTSP
jgi:multidrug efflux pump subunit AcrB